MRTLGDIIEAVKGGQKPEYEELRYAVVALEALTTFDASALRDLAEAQEAGRKPMLTCSATWQMEESFRRMKTALGKSPQEWVGWNNDPDNPEYQKRRGVALKLVDRLFGT